MTQDQHVHDDADVAEVAATINRLKAGVAQVVVGQERLIERLIIALLTKGHVLVEGVPGLAKTLSIHTLAMALGAPYSRIQFTPDLLPADLVGTRVFDADRNVFNTWKGPVFANLVLADEINRAPAKVQSGLLEAMQEGKVTIGNETHDLPKPFFVMATQNPLELDGTYPLPEAQVDRFMMKVNVDYPSRAEEREIMDRMGRTNPECTIEPVCSLEDFQKANALVDSVYMDERIIDYVLDLTVATRMRMDELSDKQDASLFQRFAPLIECGASPRATIFLSLAAKAMAFLNGRNFVIPEDVKDMAVDVLAHRIIPTYEAEAEDLSARVLIEQLVDCVSIP